MTGVGSGSTTPPLSPPDITTVVAGGLPCLSASVQSDEYRAYLCVIPGHVLADIYDQFGSRLLEGNVRSFLGMDSSYHPSISHRSRKYTLALFMSDIFSHSALSCDFIVCCAIY